MTDRLQQRTDAALVHLACLFHQGLRDQVDDTDESHRHLVHVVDVDDLGAATLACRWPTAIADRDRSLDNALFMLTHAPLDAIFPWATVAATERLALADAEATDASWPDLVGLAAFWPEDA